MPSCKYYHDCNFAPIKYQKYIYYYCKNVVYLWLQIQCQKLDLATFVTGPI